MSEWLPIETAPKTGGLYILTAIVNGKHWHMSVASWGGTYWENDEGLNTGATHWMPLPAPPVEVKEDEQRT